MRCEVETHDDVDHGEHSVPGSPLFGGLAYMDGSCVPSTIRGLARAACAVVACGADGRPWKTLQMAVPRHLPQTAQAAEHLAAALSFDSLRGTAELVGDCLGVVKAFLADAKKALAPTRKYAGLVLSSYRFPERRRTTAVRWTRAHRKMTDGTPADEAADIRGNGAADSAAGEAVGMHPPLSHDLEVEVDFRTKRIRHVVAAVSAALACYPPAPRKMGRAAPPADLEQARSTSRHLWVWSAGAWRCSACGDYINTSSVPSYRLRQRCSGKSLADHASEYAGRGHRLAKVQSDLPIICCTHCGAWGSRRARGLAQPCGDPTKAGQQAVRRILNGQHPLLVVKGANGKGPRMKANIIATYDAAQGAWRAFHPTEDRAGAREAMEATDAGGPAAGGEEIGGQELHPEVGCDQFGIEDEDVFEHGGALDNAADAGGEQGAEVAQEVGGGVSSVPIHAGANGPSRGHEAGGGPTNRGRRRARGDMLGTHRDFTAEAVQRLGASLRRSDAQAAERMRNLRRRVAAKAQHGVAALPGGQGRDSLAHEPAAPSPTSQRRSRSPDAEARTSEDEGARPRRRRRCIHEDMSPQQEVPPRRGHRRQREAADPGDHLRSNRRLRASGLGDGPGDADPAGDGREPAPPQRRPYGGGNPQEECRLENTDPVGRRSCASSCSHVSDDSFARRAMGPQRTSGDLSSAAPAGSSVHAAAAVGDVGLTLCEDMGHGDVRQPAVRAAASGGDGGQDAVSASMMGAAGGRYTVAEPMAPVGPRTGIGIGIGATRPHIAGGGSGGGFAKPLTRADLLAQLRAGGGAQLPGAGDGASHSEVYGGVYSAAADVRTAVSDGRDDRVPSERAAVSPNAASTTFCCTVLLYLPAAVRQHGQPGASAEAGAAEPIRRRIRGKTRPRDQYTAPRRCDTSATAAHGAETCGCPVVESGVG